MSAHNGPEISRTFARELEDDLAQMLVHLCLRMLPVDGNHLLRCGVQTAKKIDQKPSRGVQTAKKLIENSHEWVQRMDATAHLLE